MVMLIYTTITIGGAAAAPVVVSSSTTVTSTVLQLVRGMSCKAVSPVFVSLSSLSPQLPVAGSVAPPTVALPAAPLLRGRYSAIYFIFPILE